MEIIDNEVEFNGFSSVCGASVVNLSDPLTKTPYYMHLDDFAWFLTSGFNNCLEVTPGKVKFVARSLKTFAGASYWKRVVPAGLE